MSTHFFLKHRSEYIRLTFLAGKSVAETTERKRATPFSNEAEAWHAAYTHHLRSDWCEVEPANQTTAQLELA